MKKGSAQAAPPSQSGHFNIVKIEVSRPSVPLLKAETHQNKGKPTANTPVSAENRSRAGRNPQRGTLRFSYILEVSHWSAEVSRCFPATVEAGARAADDHA